MSPEEALVGLGWEQVRSPQLLREEDCALPAEKGMKKSLFLKVPFWFKKCPGLNSVGFGNSLLS